MTCPNIPVLEAIFLVAYASTRKRNVRRMIMLEGSCDQESPLHFVSNGESVTETCAKEKDFGALAALRVFFDVLLHVDRDC